MAATCVAAIAVFRSPAARASERDSVFEAGEELIYNVSYASVDIGQINIRLVRTVLRNDTVYHRASAAIDSYRGIPFVNLHAVFQTEMTTDAHAVWFSSRTRGKDRHWDEAVYHFRYPDRKLLIARGVWQSDSVTARDTLQLDTLSQDGLSLFYCVRKMLMTRHRVLIPSYVNEKKGTTVIDFPGEVTSETIESVNYPVDVVHIRGKADFVGVFGLTGDFEGWFSHDAARIPVLAKMKVLLGNIRVELISWKHGTWTPPRAGAQGGKEKP